MRKRFHEDKLGVAENGVVEHDSSKSVSSESNPMWSLSNDACACEGHRKQDAGALTSNVEVALHDHEHSLPRKH